MCERSVDWLPHARPQPGTWLWSAIQECALTRNGTSDPSVCGTMPNPPSRTSQGRIGNLRDAPAQTERLWKLCELRRRDRLWLQRGQKGGPSNITENARCSIWGLKNSAHPAVTEPCWHLLKSALENQG